MTRARGKDKAQPLLDLQESPGPKPAMDRWDQDCRLQHPLVVTPGCAWDWEGGGVLSVGPPPRTSTQAHPLVLLAAFGAATWSQSGIWMFPQTPRERLFIFPHPRPLGILSSPRMRGLSVCPLVQFHTLPQHLEDYPQR